MKTRYSGIAKDLIRFSVWDFIKMLLGFTINECGRTYTFWAFGSWYYNDKHLFQKWYRILRGIDNK